MVIFIFFYIEALLSVYILIRLLFALLNVIIQFVNRFVAQSSSRDGTEANNEGCPIHRYQKKDTKDTAHVLMFAKSH